MSQKFLFILLILFSVELCHAQIDDEEISDESIDNSVIKNDPKKRKIKEENNWFKVDNIFVGTTFSLLFGNYLFLDISPYAGYLIGDYIGVGIGGTYIYSAYSPSQNVLIEDHIYGGRIFANLRPFPKLKGLRGVYAHIEGEYLNRESPTVLNRRIFVPAVNVGLGYNTNFDKGFAFTTEILINALWFSQVRQSQPTVFRTPWQYRVGIYYAF